MFDSLDAQRMKYLADEFERYAQQPQLRRSRYPLEAVASLAAQTRRSQTASSLALELASEIRELVGQPQRERARRLGRQLHELCWIADADACTRASCVC